jgi:fructose-bisphosphate aldolase class 1
LIVHIGSNDLRTGVKAVTLIEALQQVVQNAKKTYRRVFGTTILSGGYTREQAEQRQLVNNWILGDGNQRFDAVFDFCNPIAG